MLLAFLNWAALWASLLGLLVSYWPLIVGGGLAVLALWWMRDPDHKFRKYEGWVIQAVKLAEKAIPNDSPSKSVQKADEFMAEFLRIYAEGVGHEASPALKVWADNLKEKVLLKYKDSVLFGKSRPADEDEEDYGEFDLEDDEDFDPEDDE